jgi:hypothetical protein
MSTVERAGDREIIEKLFPMDEVYFCFIDSTHCRPNNVYAIAIVHCTGYTTWCLACVNEGRAELWNFSDCECNTINVLDNEEPLPHDKWMTEEEYAELIRADK